MTFILASASPRRRQLLAEAGYDFEVDPSGVPEPDPDDGPRTESLVTETLSLLRSAPC